MTHVLLVDDDSDLIESNRLYLESRGYTVSTAYSGKEGWELLAKDTPDILILDCMMEEFTTGFELAWDIGIKYPKLPMIMLSGVREYMSADWNFGQGDKEWLPIHHFMEKPVAPDLLYNEIQRMLDAAQKMNSTNA